MNPYDVFGYFGYHAGNYLDILDVIIWIFFSITLW